MSDVTTCEVLVHLRLIMVCTRVIILYAMLTLAGLNRELGISNEFFVLGDSVVLTVLAQVSFMPILVLAARLCPEVGATSPWTYHWPGSSAPASVTACVI